MNYEKNENTIKIKVSDNPDSFFEKEYSKDNEIQIGRSEHCDLVLRSKGVSREHCRIFYQNDQWQVEDLKSQNGIRLNDKKVSLERLQNNDIIKISDYRLEIFLDEPLVEDIPDQDEDATVLFSGEDELDKTILSDGPAPAFNLPDTGQNGIIQKFLKNKLLLGGAIAFFCLFFIIIIFSLTSDAPPENIENNVLNQEVKKSENMMDMESKHRIDFYIQSGKEQYEEGKYAEALVRFQTVVTIDPAHPVALKYIDLTNQKLKAIEEQEQQKAQEQEKKMERVNLIIDRARQAFNQKQFSDAQEILAEAVFLAPNELTVQSFQSEIEDAIANDRIVKEQSKIEQEKAGELFGVLFNNGRNAYNKKDYYTAMVEWQQALDLNLEGPATDHIKKTLPKVKALLEKSLKNDYEKGRQFYMRSDFSNAVRYLKRVRLASPSYKNAGEYMDKAVKALEPRAKELYQEGLVYAGIGQTTKAEQKYRLVLTTLPLETNNYYQKALNKLNN